MPQQQQRNQIPPTRERVDKALAVSPPQNAPIAISQSAGGLLIQNAEQAMDVAHAMAGSGVAVRSFMRNNVGTCLAVVIQAIEWRMSPFAVAQKAYSVNDQLAYESQLIQAVILQRAPMKGRMRFEYEGEGQERRCTARAYLSDAEAVHEGDCVEATSPRLKDIKPQNSPLWKADPDQQLSYYTGRLLCRRFFPDVLLGVYAEDEIDREAAPRPAPGTARAASRGSVASRMDALAAGPVIENEPAQGGGAPGTMSAAEVAEQERTVSQMADLAERHEAAGGDPADLGGDRVPDGAGDVADTIREGGQAPDDDAFPGDVPTPRERRKAEVMTALRQAAGDGNRALDKAAGALPEEDVALISEEEQRSIRAIAEEVDQRAQRRGGKR